MQERRATVRVGCFLPADYRLSDASPLSPGRITNLSINGLALLASRPVGGGERLSMRFLLPGDDEPFALDGIVRWSRVEPTPQGEHPLGVEFERLDDTSQFRLQAFVTEQLEQSERFIGRLERRVSRLRQRIPSRVVRIAIWAGGIAAMLLLGAWLIALHQQNTSLRQTLVERAMVISQLEARQQQLQEALRQARTEASESLRELDRLKSQTAELEMEVGRFAQNLGEVQAAYAGVQGERDQLRQQVEALAQQQAALQAKFESIPELRKAIRTVIRSQQVKRRDARLTRIAQLRRADIEHARSGNRGFVVYGGIPTLTSSRLSIRVYTPETASVPVE